MISVSNVTDFNAVEKFVTDRMKNRPVDFQVLVGGWKVYQSYRGQGLPSTYLIDRKGRVRFYHRDFKPGLENMIEKEILALLLESG